MYNRHERAKFLIVGTKCFYCFTTVLLNVAGLVVIFLLVNRCSDYCFIAKYAGMENKWHTIHYHVFVSDYFKPRVLLFGVNH